MGTDDLHHKRKQDLKRKSNTRKIKDKILIVCEGEKTEPNYFNALKRKFRSQTATIDIDENSNSAPISVVEYAIKKAKVEQKNEDAYNVVYCIFDKDTHTSLVQALDKLPKNEKYGAKFYAILSVPCFEFWLLLHFAYTTKNFYAQGEQSPCENLIKTMLKSHIADYAKGYNDFSQIITDESLDKAIQSAKQICKQLDIEEPDNKEALKEFISNDNSFTNVFLVVEKFKEIGNKLG